MKVFSEIPLLFLILAVAMFTGCAGTPGTDTRTVETPGALPVDEPEDEVTLLIGELESEDAAAREAAITGLIEKGEEAVPKLVEALSSEHSGVRTGASEALVIIGEPAVPYLIQKIETGEGTPRGLAAFALGGIGAISPAVVPAIMATLDSEDPETVYLGILALRMIGPGAREALPALERVAASDIPSLRGVAENAIIAIRDR